MFKDKAQEGEKPEQPFGCEDFEPECNAVIRHLKHLYHEGCYECKDSVELRESGVDHGIGLNVVTL